MNRIIADTRNASQHWERRCDPLPYLLVPMSDGSTLRFNPEVKHPGFQMAMKNIENMTIGYERKDEK